MAAASPRLFPFKLVLIPLVRLYSNTGTLLASNDDYFDNESFIGYTDFSYVGDYYIAADSFGSGTGTYTLIVTQTTADPQFPVRSDTDYFSFSLAAGQSVTLAAQLAGPGVGPLQLCNAAGTILASGTAASNVSQVIDNFVAETSGTYYARLTNWDVDYNLVAIRRCVR